MSQRRSKHTAKVNKSRMALTITHPNAAGIDIGSGTDKLTFFAAKSGYLVQPTNAKQGCSGCGRQ